MIGPEEIAKRFGSTAKSPAETRDDHEHLRQEFVRLAQLIDVMMFDGREKSLAMTQLEDASMWSQKALALSLKMKQEPTP